MLLIDTLGHSAYWTALVINDGPSFETLLIRTRYSSIDLKQWFSFVPGTVQPFQIFFPASISCFVMKRNLIPWSCLPQNLNKSLGVNILSEVGRLKLALAANRFVVPPIPSHGDFPWLEAKKFHSALMAMSSWCWHKFLKFLKFFIGQQSHRWNSWCASAL